MPEQNNSTDLQPNNTKNLGNSIGGQKVIQPSESFAQEMQSQQEESEKQSTSISVPNQPALQQVPPHPAYPAPALSPTLSTVATQLAPAINSHGRKKTIFIISIGMVTLITLGVISLMALDHKDKTTNAPGVSKSSQSSGTKPTDLSINPKLSSLNTSEWPSYTDPTMKVSFKYPASISTKDSRIKLYPPKAPTAAIQSEVSVGAEIVKTGSSGIVTPIIGTTLFDVVTYAPGSPNDKISDLKSEAIVYYKTKSITASGTSGTCEYYAIKYDSSHKYYACKFHKNNLVYSVVGSSPNSDIASQFPNVDFWTISQKMLETFQFSD